MSRKHVFIIGSKGIPASYGGFETFVQELVRRRVTTDIVYHIACSIPPEDGFSRGQSFRVFGVRCFYIPMIGRLGSANAVVYDLQALEYCLRCIREYRPENAVVYILACRIGPLIGWYARKLKKLGVTVMVNPDGHEWLRAKWSRPVRAYWKYSEGKMVKAADLVICDSRAIAGYITKQYRKRPETIRYIAYGADVAEEDISSADRDRAYGWLKEHGLVPGEYYLMVGRLVPENNYETILREFSSSATKKNLAIICDLKDNRFYEKFRNTADSRIIFTGTLYDPGVLKAVRRSAYAYLHGHEVGGTNPSLLEGLGNTDLNLVYDVAFNREVADDGALYWTKQKGSLCFLIDRCDCMKREERSELGFRARQIISERYSWNKIVSEYEDLFLEGPAGQKKETAGR